VQDAPAASDEPQVVLLTVKSEALAPEKLNVLVPATGQLPLFVSVTE
jgi:hypothetical protein